MAPSVCAHVGLSQVMFPGPGAGCSLRGSADGPHILAHKGRGNLLVWLLPVSQLPFFFSCLVTVQVTHSVPLQARLLMWLLPEDPLYCLGKRAGTSAADRWDSHRTIPRWQNSRAFQVWAHGILAPQPWMEPASHALEDTDLITGPPGKSQQYRFDIFKWLRRKDLIRSKTVGIQKVSETAGL
ncbi:hypothetical protein R6Z07F_015468 [Ovis aries]